MQSLDQSNGQLKNQIKPEPLLSWPTATAAAAAAISATSTIPFRALTDHSIISTAVLIIPFYRLTCCFYQPLF